MSDVLALAGGRGVRVNACGRLVDISPESSGSVLLLRRELGAQLNVCNPASLQLQDTCGNPVSTDNDLFAAMQDGRHPLQAKLTAAALHEIEQKKLEGRSKEHNLLSLQWQIVIEQVSAFSYELASVAGQLQSVKDDCHKQVRAFEDAEILRREQLQQLVKDETTERKNGHNHIMEKIDALMAMMLAEQQAREVADYQLAKQIEQAGQDLHADRTRYAKHDAEHSRTMAAMKQELDHHLQKNTESWTRNADLMQRVEHRLEEHSAADLAQQQRLTLLEADCEKLRIAVAHVDTALTKHHSDVHSQLSRHGEELQRAVKDSSVGASGDLNKVAKEHETARTNIDNRLTRLQSEAAKTQQELAERTKMIELRCAALEKEHVDRQEVSDIKAREFAEKVHQAATILDTFKIEQQANETVTQTLVSKVEELTERLHNAEVALDNRVSGEHWRAQLDGIAQITRKQDSKIFMLEREIHARMQQENNHRDELRNQIQGSLKNCLEKISPHAAKEAEEHGFQKLHETDSHTQFPPATVIHHNRALGTMSPQRIRLDTAPASLNTYAMAATTGVGGSVSVASPAPMEVVTPSVTGSPVAWETQSVKTLTVRQQAPPRSLSPQPRVVYSTVQGVPGVSVSPAMASGRSGVSVQQSVPTIMLNGTQ